MKKSHPNPFKFGDPVEGDYYLPRKDLSGLMSHFLENRIHVVLIGPRRFGKTSFVLNLLKDFEAKGYATLFMDIFNITSHMDFLNQILRALHSKKTWLEKFKKRLLKLRPKLTTEYDSITGQATFGMSLQSSSEKDVKEVIQEVLDELVMLGDKVIIAIDEFQKVCEIDDKGWLEATLRTHMQQMRNTTFLFTGSRKSIIYDMLNNSSRPFYRSCQPIEFPSFGDEFTDWILERFSEIGIRCQRKAIEHLREIVQDTPNYVQMICFYLVAEGRNNIGIEEIDNALSTVVRQNAYAYQTLLNTLSLSQQRALRLAASHAKQVFSKGLLLKYQLSSAAVLSSAIQNLKAKGILDEEGTGRGVVIFDDPLFAIWLRFTFGESQQT
jgi:AAA+ ATPase superfamily predicted ATPase